MVSIKYIAVAIFAVVLISAVSAIPINGDEQTAPAGGSIFSFGRRLFDGIRNVGSSIAKRLPIISSLDAGEAGEFETNLKAKKAASTEQTQSQMSEPSFGEDEYDYEQDEENLDDEVVQGTNQDAAPVADETFDEEQSPNEVDTGADEEEAYENIDPDSVEDANDVTQDGDEEQYEAQAQYDDQQQEVEDVPQETERSLEEPQVDEQQQEDEEEPQADEQQVPEEQNDQAANEQGQELQPEAAVEQQQNAQHDQVPNVVDHVVPTLQEQAVEA